MSLALFCFCKPFGWVGGKPVGLLTGEIEIKANLNQAKLDGSRLKVEIESGNIFDRVFFEKYADEQAKQCYKKFPSYTQLHTV